MGYKTKNIIWKKHGILLSIKPITNLKGHLSLDISTEVSIIDAAQTIDGIPGLKTNRMSTQIEQSKPHPIALSGLIRKDWGISKEQIPYFAQIPVLGSLFKSKNYLNQKSELIIFILPQILPQDTNESFKFPKEWNDESI